MSSIRTSKRISSDKLQSMNPRLRSLRSNPDFAMVPALDCPRRRSPSSVLPDIPITVIADHQTQQKKYKTYLIADTIYNNAPEEDPLSKSTLRYKRKLPHLLKRLGLPLKPQAQESLVTQSKELEKYVDVEVTSNNAEIHDQDDRRMSILPEDFATLQEIGNDITKVLWVAVINTKIMYRVMGVNGEERFLHAATIHELFGQKLIHYYEKRVFSYD